MHPALLAAPPTIIGPAHQFQASGVKREHWRTAAPIRAIFREAFAAAGLPYFNPHSFRNAHSTHRDQFFHAIVITETTAS